MDTFRLPAPTRPLATAGHVHDEHCGHEVPEETMAAGLRAGLALVLVAALVLGLLLGARVMRRRAARRVPCGECGTYFDPNESPACPSCGRAPNQTGSNE